MIDSQLFPLVLIGLGVLLMVAAIMRRFDEGIELETARSLFGLGLAFLIAGGFLGMLRQAWTGLIGLGLVFTLAGAFGLGLDWVRQRRVSRY